jgi:hypothetical protein
VHVGPAEAAAVEAILLDALERFLLGREHRLGQISQELKDRPAVAQVTARVSPLTRKRVILDQLPRA